MALPEPKTLLNYLATRAGLSLAGSELDLRVKSRVRGR